MPENRKYLGEMLRSVLAIQANLAEWVVHSANKVVLTVLYHEVAGSAHEISNFICCINFC